MFVDQNKDDVVEGRRLGVEPICEVLQVALSSYYAARHRPPCARERPRSGARSAAGGDLEGQLPGLRGAEVVEDRPTGRDRYRS